MAAAAGVLLLLFALFTVGQGLYLNANGVTTQAEVVDGRHGGRSDFVRVRVSSGDETNLWAWKGSPEVGETMTVVHLQESNWAKDARVFAPEGSIWPDLWLGVLFLGGALWQHRRTRRPSASPAGGKR
ncbi:hypothetical protein [Micromonospora sp. M71_S20]|uniref:hypothetical protein n=1 Tax=Micromonospora sp. M71_S20 TaxID=592872 RepID=UPI0011E5C767|nr:hypothetical protein [Micromonospora sp. M71_S20]